LPDGLIVGLQDPAAFFAVRLSQHKLALTSPPKIENVPPTRRIFFLS